jgi:ABC-type thiamine transport system substrate-binding protein
MKQALTKEQILEFFCKDMEQPAIQMALYRSFARYADLRDELARQYEEKTKIPVEEFLSAYAVNSFLKTVD